jgi:hypothetical protein
MSVEMMVVHKKREKHVHQRVYNQSFMRKSFSFTIAKQNNFAISNPLGKKKINKKINRIFLN